MCKVLLSFVDRSGRRRNEKMSICRLRWPDLRPAKHSTATQAKQRFPKLNVCSFDKGFHSKDNQAALKAQLDLVVLPRKGKLSQVAKEEEQAPEFVKARRAHSAVESAINGLGVHGLDVCPDHGIEGFKRYVALAVLTRNIHRIGAIVWNQDMERAQRKSRYADPDKPVKLAA